MGFGRTLGQWKRWDGEDDMRLQGMAKRFQAAGMTREETWERIGVALGRSSWSVRNRYWTLRQDPEKRAAKKRAGLAALAATDHGAARRERYARAKARKAAEITETLEQALQRKRDGAARLAEEDERIATDTRTLAQIAMGEPHPSRSALQEYNRRMALCTLVEDDA